MSSTNRGAKRQPQDSYDTPLYSLQALLWALNDTSPYTLLEPCRGGRVIFDNVSALEKFWCEITEGIDYFSEPHRAEMIITNPPYLLATEFIEKSLEESPFVAYLLRLNFYGTVKRYEWWKDRMPTHTLVLSKRPSFVHGRTSCQDSCEYAWFVWDALNLCRFEPGVVILPPFGSRFYT
jgi:hypothetical protein